MNNFDEVTIEIDGENCVFYKCKIPRDQKFQDLQNWLSGSYISEDYVWNAPFPMTNEFRLFDHDTIYFKSKEDATMFLLSFY